MITEGSLFFNVSERVWRFGEIISFVAGVTSRGLCKIRAPLEGKMTFPSEYR